MGKFLPKKLLSAFLALVTGFCMVLTAASPAAADTSDASGTSSVAADSATVTTNAISGWPQAADVYSKCACLMDADTGTVPLQQRDGYPDVPGFDHEDHDLSFGA
ncbi:MAG: hypothetical protein LKM41_02035 [Lachnospiraceae bacterium]|jgi:D-alanyl-D-alanine carboxypeptidase|nr:hypothetical protein [Lachnospiraceae bacterium]